jgi:multiple sugar transport system substrate-binding protein
MQRKSAKLVSLFLSFLTAFTVGCGRPPAPVEDNGPPLVLRVSCPDNQAEAIIQAFSRNWAARQNAHVAVIRYDPASGPEAVAGADVWLLAPAELPLWAAAGKLEPIPKNFTDREGAFAWKDLLPQLRELAVWDRIEYGFPVLGESPICFYRSDLFADPKHQTAFQAKYQHPLGPPATWEEFVEIAEYFQKHAATDRFPHSLPPLAATDDGLDREYFQIAAAFARRAVSEEEPAEAARVDDVFAFHYDLRSGQPRIASPGFVYSLNRLKELQTYRPQEPVAEPAEAFAQGKAVLCLADAPWAARFQKSDGIRDKFSTCTIPGGERYFSFETGEERSAREPNRVPYLGAAGFLGVVPRGAAHGKEAFDLLANLAGRETSGRIVINPRWGGGAIRSEQLDERSRWDDFQLDGSRTAALKEALRQTLLHRGTKNPVLRLRTPDQGPHRAALLEKLRSVLLQGAEPKSALQAAAQRWEKLDQQRGEAKHKTEYALSVGLEGR